MTSHARPRCGAVAASRRTSFRITGTAGYFPGYSSTSRDATLWVGVVGSMSACGIRSGSAALIRVHESRMGLEATSAGFPLSYERRGGVLTSKKDQARR